jgi:hypothetical protein
MGFYINNLDDFSKPTAPTIHGICLYCKTKPITGSRRKFCSLECAHAYHQPLKKTRANKKLKCNWCNKTFVSKKGKPHFYCSKDCYNQKQYEKNRGFSRKDVSRIDTDMDLTSDSYRFHRWLPGHIIMNEEVTATLANLPNKPYIYEDMVELNRIIIEELPPATCVDGTLYKKSKKYTTHGRLWQKGRNKKNGKGKEPVAVDEEKSPPDTPTKN